MISCSICLNTEENESKVSVSEQKCQVVVSSVVVFMSVWPLCVVPNLYTISSQQSDPTVNNANGLKRSPVSIEVQSKPTTADSSTQTEPTFLLQDVEQNKVQLSRPAQRLQLEDALPPSVEGTRVKLHRVPGIEEEQDEEEEGGGDPPKERTWVSSVEEPIQPSSVRSLQRQDFQDRSSSMDGPGSAPASLKGSDPSLNLRSGPLSPIQEGEKTLCVSSSLPNINNPFPCVTAWLQTQSTLTQSFWFKLQHVLEQETAFQCFSIHLFDLVNM